MAAQPERAPGERDNEQSKNDPFDAFGALDRADELTARRAIETLQSRQLDIHCHLAGPVLHSVKRRSGEGLWIAAWHAGSIAVLTLALSEMPSPISGPRNS